MSIYQPGSPGIYSGFVDGVGRPNDPCFLCQEDLGLRHAVTWSGDIFLHAACALKLGVHLISDATKAEAEDEGRFQLRKLLDR